MMKENGSYYVSEEAGARGPFTLEQLKEMRFRGEIQDDTWVAREGWAEWKAFGAVIVMAGPGPAKKRNEPEMGNVLIVLVVIALLVWISISGAPEAMVILLLLLGVAIYFLPSIVAGSRDHRNLAALFVLNLLLGWTIVGWAGAMVWAFYRERAKGDS